MEKLDYKEKYEQALERAKNYHEGHTLDVNPQSAMEYVFPELKESENEKIRKTMLYVIKQLDENTTICGRKYDYQKWISWLEKQGGKNPAEPVTVIERDGEQWVRVCALGEDFIIAAHNYREGDKNGFTWKEACEIGTFNKKQDYIMLALKDKINARLEEIGGEPLASGYWSSSESHQPNAWLVSFYSGSVYNTYKYYSYVARAVAAF